MEDVPEMKLTAPDGKFKGALGALMATHNRFREGDLLRRIYSYACIIRDLLYCNGCKL